MEVSWLFETISAQAGGKLNNRDSRRQQRCFATLLVATSLSLATPTLASHLELKPSHLPCRRARVEGHLDINSLQLSEAPGAPIRYGGSPQSTPSTEEYKEITVVGRVSCLDRSGKPLSIEGGCDLHKYRLGFLASDGKLFSFWPEDALGPMLADPRVNKYKLQLGAVLHGGNQLETFKVQAVKEGKLYDLYYFCHVCNITAYSPGPCPCCYQELEFIERPATDH